MQKIISHCQRCVARNAPRVGINAICAASGIDITPALNFGDTALTNNFHAVIIRRGQQFHSQQQKLYLLPPKGERVYESLPAISLPGMGTLLPNRRKTSACIPLGFYIMNKHQFTLMSQPYHRTFTNSCMAMNKKSSREDNHPDNISNNHTEKLAGEKEGV